jgi:hypothetical protein
MEGLLERHGALLERVTQLERTLEKLVEIGRKSDSLLPQTMASIAQAGLDGFAVYEDES